VTFPTVAPMAPVPAGGWAADVPAEVATLLEQFDTTYAAVLAGLNTSWSPPGTRADLQNTIGTMFELAAPAQQLMAIPIAGGTGNYGPAFGA
jgi:hypothetical protein